MIKMGYNRRYYLLFYTVSPLLLIITSKFLGISDDLVKAWIGFCCWGISNVLLTKQHDKKLNAEMDKKDE